PEQHAARYLALAEELAAGLKTPQRAATLDRFEQHHGDFTSALDYLVERGDGERAVRMIRALRDCWWEGGRIQEGRVWAERVAALPHLQADPGGHATALDLAGALAFGQQDHEAARRHFEQSLAIRREIGSKAHVAQSLHHLAAVVRWGCGKPAEARTLLEECLAAAREAGNEFLISAGAGSLGTVALDLGDHAEARSFMVQAVAMNVEGQRVTSLPFALDNFAALAAAEGQPDRALRLAGAAARQHERLGTFQLAHTQAWVERYLALAREALTQEASAAAWADGQAMTLEQAITYALSEQPPA
ncbi:MAG: tetratricopeptide repeat protein, partial [Chloroflexota bacterium]